MEASPEEVQKVPATPVVAPLENCDSLDGEKKNKPSDRVRKVLKDAKEERLRKEAAQNSASTTGTPTQHPAPVDDFVEQIEAMLPEKPKDWLDKHTPVSAEQQEPAKPRGRKKKTTNDDGAPTAKAKAKAKAKARVSKKNDVKAKPKAKSPRNKGLNVIKQIGKRKQKKPQQYEPLEVETLPLPDKGNAFDNYAAASAAADVHKLQAKGSNEGNKGNDKPKKGAVDSKKRKAATQQMSAADKKARLSRKSCAYKKSYNQHIKDGSSEEVARAAAKQVS